METIKFRIYDPVEKAMRYSGATPMMLSSFFKSFAILDTVHKMKWQQFTGLLDKNEKEIYEGDVVKRIGDFGTEQYPNKQECIEVVEFNNACFNPICEEPIENFEIIGNIYENPELL